MITPNTLDEAIKELSVRGDVVQWADLPERVAMGHAHHGIGRWIRNNWGLWKGEGELYKYFVNLGLDHADDMSGVILTSLHRTLNGKDLGIRGEVDKYLKHWEKMSEGKIDVNFVDAFVDAKDYNDI